MCDSKATDNYTFPFSIIKKHLLKKDNSDVLNTLRDFSVFLVHSCSGTFLQNITSLDVSVLYKGLYKLINHEDKAEISKTWSYFPVAINIFHSENFPA